MKISAIFLGPKASNLMVKNYASRCRQARIAGQRVSWGGVLLEPPCKGVEAAKDSVMIELTTETVKETGKLASISRGALPGFHYQNGYAFSATDLGNHGVKLELLHENDVAAAIILPPKMVAKCGRWRLQTLGQDRHGLPNGLAGGLRRLNKQKAAGRLVQRGGQKMPKDAIR